MASLVLKLDKCGDCNAHCIGCSVQRTVKAWDRVAVSVRFRSREELVQPFVVLGRPWVRFGVLNDEKEETFLNRNESALYNLKASLPRNHEQLLNLVQVLPCNVDAASRAFSKHFLEDVSDAVFFPELHSMASKSELE